MSAFKDFFFNHTHYKEVIETYKIVVKCYSKAFSIWCHHYNYSDTKTYLFKELVLNHIGEIKKINNWINIASRYLPSSKEAVEWLFHEKNIDREPSFIYDDLELIGNNENKILHFKDLLSTFISIYYQYIDASRYFLKTSSSQLSFEQKLNIINSENEIKEIDKILKGVYQLKNSFPQIWTIFLNGRDIFDIPLSELKEVSPIRFTTKEKFLDLYHTHKSIIELILGPSTIPISTFDSDSFSQELFVINSLRNENFIDFSAYCDSIKIDNEESLKRAILDSEFYGINCNFADTFSVSRFYNLRFDFEKIKTSFDTALSKINNNKDAVKRYNTERGKDPVVYIENYLESVTPDKPLFIYLNTYQQERAKREEAKQLQSSYNLGFFALYGNKDLDNCSLSDICNIISSKTLIKTKHEYLYRIEQVRIENERKRLKIQHKQQELQELKSCVSSWIIPDCSSIKYFSMYYYYPTTCDWEATEDEWNIRKLIWDFKANPSQPTSESLIKSKHEQAINKILPIAVKVIKHYFGNQRFKLTLVCIPSSKQKVTERRYKDWAQRLCEDTGMSNGYNHISVIRDGDAKHLGGGSAADFSIDTTYFNDKNIILFDDVITTGRSMERLKNILEAAGANVICGLSIGKTKHNRQLSNPINDIFS